MASDGVSRSAEQALRELFEATRGQEFLSSDMFIWLRGRNQRGDPAAAVDVLFEKAHSPISVGRLLTSRLLGRHGGYALVYRPVLEIARLWRVLPVADDADLDALAAASGVITGKPQPSVPVPTMATGHAQAVVAAQPDAPPDPTTDVRAAA